MLCTPVSTFGIAPFRVGAAPSGTSSAIDSIYEASISYCQAFAVCHLVKTVHIAQPSRTGHKLTASVYRHASCMDRSLCRGSTSFSVRRGLATASACDLEQGVDG